MALSISDRIKLRRERKLNESRQALADTTGIVFSPELEGEKTGFPLLKYLVNALILFFAGFGSIYCVVSAFEIELSTGPLLLTCIFFSLVLSFMYTRQRLKVVTYLAILFGFVYIIIRYYTLVNSGVNALINSILSYTDSRITLPYLREFTVYYTDTYTAMSVAVCVIAVGLMILQNIMVSEKMSLRGLFFFTFPLACLGMYFNFDSAKTGMIFVAVSWALVEIIFLTGGYFGLTDKLTVSSSIKNHRHSYGFVTDAGNTSKIAVIWLVFIAAVTALVFALVPQTGFEIRLPLRDFRQESYRVAKNFMSYGTSSLFSQEREANAPGRLSNVNSISYDGRTDLEIETVNRRVNRFYLRSFAGYAYDGGSLRWFNMPSGTDYSKEYDLSYRILSKKYAGDKADISRWKIGIRTVDPVVAAQGLNAPYYTTLRPLGSVRYTGPGSAVSPDGGVGKQVFFDVYSPEGKGKTPGIEDFRESDPEFYDSVSQELAQMRAQAEKNALYVPEKNLPAIKAFCEQYSITPGESIDEITGKITGAFGSDYEYTLRPGKVPQNEDYINYFLAANKRGYCQHFASSAVMIYRYLGIPARYAEGYAIDREDFYGADVYLPEKLDEWVTSSYFTDRGVSTIFIPDSNGHAWVEVFGDGFGWQPVEVTTALSGDDGRGFLNGLLQLSRPGSTQGAAEMVSRMTSDRTMAAMATLGLTVLGILLAIYLIRMALAVLPRHLAFARGGSREIIYRRYSHLCDTSSYAHGTRGASSYREFFGEDTAFAARLEKCLFSGTEPDEDEAKALCEEMNRRRRATVKAMPLPRRIRYILVDFMW